MTAVLIVAASALTILLGFSSLLQLLYLESLRLRTRETAALQYFKSDLYDLLGREGEAGATAFSLIKHTSIVLLGVANVSLVLRQRVPVWEAVLIAAVLSWAILIAAAYLVPQLLYRRTQMHWLKPLVPLAKVLALAALPFAGLLTLIYSLVELSSPRGDQRAEPDAAEHIEALISAGEEEGLIEEDDRKLIQSVVAFGDKTVREIMTPRPSIIAIEAGKPLEELRQLVINEQYSRIPVYESNIDQISGFVHVRDMFEIDQAQRKGRKVRELMRPIRLVPETKAASDLMREMQKDGAHMAVVIDEYGNTAGLVTMEDLVEVIVGEIHDEHEPERDVVEESPGVFVVSGSFDVDRLHDLAGYRSGEETVSTTVGGLISELLGHVPAVGEVANSDGIRLEVLAGNELRVERVRISRINPGDEKVAES
jgi:CBS domain containing-hemolysin-like protein